LNKRLIQLSAETPKRKSGLVGKQGLWTNTVNPIHDKLYSGISMELIGEVLVQATRGEVWTALNDPVVLQTCIPGCEQVTDESESVRLVKLMVKLGPVRARFAGRVTQSEVLVPERCTMAFEGSGGAAGMASGRSQVELFESADGAATRLTYTVKASVGGKLGQIGGRMLDASAKQLADQFFAALGAHLQPPAPESVVEEALISDSVAPVIGAAAALPALRVAAQMPPQLPAPQSEMSRIVWFLMGVASTGFGVWLGANLL
jgi:carbon monoxide dehydrogenase subunit G